MILFPVPTRFDPFLTLPRLEFVDKVLRKSFGLLKLCVEVSRPQHDWFVKVSNFGVLIGAKDVVTDAMRLPFHGDRHVFNYSPWW